MLFPADLIHLQNPSENVEQRHQSFLGILFVSLSQPPFVLFNHLSPSVNLQVTKFDLNRQVPFLRLFISASLRFADIERNLTRSVASVAFFNCVGYTCVFACLIESIILRMACRQQGVKGLHLQRNSISLP